MQKSLSFEEGIRHEKPAVERILRSALRCLTQGDVERVSMREIAQEAGVSKSLLHYHFRSKDELILELVDRFFDSMIRRIDAVGWPLSEPGAGPDAMIPSVEMIWSELRRSGEIQAICLRVAARGTLEAPVRARIVAVRMRLRKIIAAGIRRGLGETRAVDADTLAELLLATLVGLEVNRIFSDDPADVEGAFELFKQLAGLGLRRA